MGQVYAARLTASTCRSQIVTWFQLALFWSTIHPSLALRASYGWQAKRAHVIRAIEREWAMAKAWLHQRLSTPHGPSVG